MSSLMDIGPLYDEITIRGIKINIFGITANRLFYLFTRYPVLGEAFMKAGDKFTPEVIMGLGTAPLHAVIAAVTTDRDKFSSDADWREVVEKSCVIAGRLSIGDQLEILVKAFKITFPEGKVGPLVEMLKEIESMIVTAQREKPSEGNLSGAASLNGGIGGNIPQGTPSQERLSAQLQTGIRGMTHGIPPLANSKPT